MALVEVPAREQQLSFKAFDLAGAVSQLLKTEAEKSEAVDAFNSSIKLLKKKIAKLSAEIDLESRK